MLVMQAVSRKRVGSRYTRDDVEGRRWVFSAADSTTTCSAVNDSTTTNISRWGRWMGAKKLAREADIRGVSTISYAKPPTSTQRRPSREVTESCHRRSC